MQNLADASDFGHFFAEHRPMLERIAGRITGDHTLAQDVVANASVRVWRRFQVYVPDQPLAYLCRAVQNEALDQLRHTSAARRREHVWGVDEVDSMHFEGLIDNRDLLHRLLPTLPEKQRRALELRYLADLTDEQIAERLGVGVVTVRSNAHRGLARLREELVGAALQPA